MKRKTNVLSSNEFDNKSGVIKMPQNSGNHSPRRYENQISSPSPFSKISNKRSHKDSKKHIIEKTYNEQDYMIDHQNDHKKMIHKQSSIPNRSTKINRQIKKTQQIPAKPPTNPISKVTNSHNIKNPNDKKKLNNSPDKRPYQLPRIDTASKNKRENKSPSSNIPTSVSSTYSYKQKSLPKLESKQSQRGKSNKFTDQKENEKNLIKSNSIKRSSTTKNQINNESKDKMTSFQFNERTSSKEIQNDEQDLLECIKYSDKACSCDLYSQSSSSYEEEEQMSYTIICHQPISIIMETVSDEEYEMPSFSS